MEKFNVVNKTQYGESGRPGRQDLLHSQKHYIILHPPFILYYIIRLTFIIIYVDILIHKINPHLFFLIINMMICVTHVIRHFTFILNPNGLGILNVAEVGFKWIDCAGAINPPPPPLLGLIKSPVGLTNNFHLLMKLFSVFYILCNTKTMERTKFS